MKRLKKILRISLKTLLIVAAALLLFLAGFLIYHSIYEYKPRAAEALKPQGAAGLRHITYAELTFMSWNIGYCGLGKEMDFFYDGGKQMRPGAELYNKYMNGVFNFLSKNDSVDFLLVQEVDQQADRSYNTNQVTTIQEALPSHSYVFAMNYDAYVPMPLFNPMANVKSGLMSFSKYSPSTAYRYSYPEAYTWPMKLFMLDRCFIIERFRVVNGKELVLINTHNSAYADTDSARMYELYMLRGFMLGEYEKGNYVVAGGDWNQSPPDHDSLTFFSSYVRQPNVSTIPPGFWPPDWTWAYDKKQPTNRSAAEPYTAGVTPTCIIDFFVVSPNIKVTQIKTIATGFEFSDHQPVFMKVQLQDSPQNRYGGTCDEIIKNLQDSIRKIQQKKVAGSGNSKTPEINPDRFFQRK
jgi:endonuclease/exonuclease/phosphatase family metal-dependent hydrolase